MTRPFNQKVVCMACGAITTAETSFSRWLRMRPDLDSSVGLCVADVDYIIHRFKTANDGREFQCLMMVEVKTQSRNTSDSQRDTLSIFSQFLRNRKNTPTAKIPAKQADATVINKARSYILKRDVNVRLFGFHLLQFQQTGPDDGWIKWDNKPIDQETLAKLIRFDLDPDKITPLDLRNHHLKPQHTLLDWASGLGFELETTNSKQ